MIGQEGQRPSSAHHYAERNLDNRIEQAKRRVEQGRRIIARQRKRIVDGSAAADLLETFEQSQTIFEEDLARLLRERDGR
ncbi:hypothetical protein CQ12_39995 [Bradyrhizobium jicamae]|uniref:Uncharacterized protein n=1 Tax=Bradyrhizobium jicamae TaxID=280332 RepID=A0A0R3LYI0_9BRAD|nr:hypothetical protein [Bradyrhizobium jicamae]KRR10767.1 hypothetical protein CQ12_39995 [Bradyrhizobium jicamae]